MYFSTMGDRNKVSPIFIKGTFFFVKTNFSMNSLWVVEKVLNSGIYLRSCKFDQKSKTEIIKFKCITAVIVACERPKSSSHVVKLHNLLFVVKVKNFRLFLKTVYFDNCTVIISLGLSWQQWESCRRPRCM